MTRLNINPKLVLVPNMAPVQSDYSFSPYTGDELAALPFCPAYKAKLREIKNVNMLPSEFFWNGDDCFLNSEVTPEILADIRLHTGGPGWERMSVKDQCALFGLDLLVTDAIKFSGVQHRTKPYSRTAGLKVEQFALDCYRAQGWEGHFDEGFMFGAFIDVVARKVEADGQVFHRWDEDGTQVGGDVLTQLQVHALNKAIAAVADHDLIKVAARFAKSEGRNGRTPDPSSGKIICAAWKILGPEKLFRMLEADMVNFGTSGWPDLLLVKGNEIRFVEVKAKRDVLRKNQALWLRNFCKPMHLPMQVLHLVD